MEWHRLDENDRIKKFYSNFTISDFWEWWSDGNNKVMEIRIKDYNIMRETAKRFKLPYSPSGVYINNSVQLKNVIAFVRDKTTMWFGINPRKRNFDIYGYKNFGGKDINVEEIKFIFIDIDRLKKKNSSATKADLMNCDYVAEKILEQLGREVWNNNYIKICSGNGVQLLIKLDFPIRMPEVEFKKSKIIKHKHREEDYYYPVLNEEFEVMKEIIRKGIGKHIMMFARKFRDDVGVEVDKACFNIGRVGALPQTKNYKYDSFTWRGIVAMRNEENTGLSDYVLSFEKDIKEFKRRSVFVKSRTIPIKERMKKGELREHKLIKFMLENDLPEGMRNNYLWFQIKCLLRDSKIDLNTNEFREIHRELEQKHGSLPTNLPNKKFQFDENIVNAFCITNLIPPLYKLWPSRTKYVDRKLDSFNWEHVEQATAALKLDSNTTIQEDMKKFKEDLIEYDYLNVERLARFTKGCILKYGEKATRYYVEYLFPRYFSWE